MPKIPNKGLITKIIAGIIGGGWFLHVLLGIGIAGFGGAVSGGVLFLPIILIVISIYIFAYYRGKSSKDNKPK